jgi:hypothetical protein
LRALPQWISSGILDYVDQIGIEIHTGLHVIKEENIISEISQMLDVLQKLYQTGFRLISSTNNDCVAKNDDLNHKYLSLTEVVFYRESV